MRSCPGPFTTGLGSALLSRRDHLPHGATLRPRPAVDRLLADEDAEVPIGEDEMAELEAQLAALEQVCRHDDGVRAP